MHKNRAKCRLCNKIIESFHELDFVECSCKHISVSGGAGMYCSAVEWTNFFRVDDLGNEIKVAVNPLDSESVQETKGLLEYDKRAILESVREMRKNIEGFPSHVMTESLNHYDYLSLLILLESILRLDCKDAT